MRELPSPGGGEGGDEGAGPRGRGSACHVTSFDCLQEARAERSASVSQAVGSVSVSLPVRGRA